MNQDILADSSALATPGAFRVTTIFGSTAVSDWGHLEAAEQARMAADMAALEAFVEDLDGTTVDRRFATGAEADAYRAGIDDSIGWLEAHEVTP